MRRASRPQSSGQRRLPDPPKPPRPRSTRAPRLVATLSVVWALALTGWFVYADREGSAAFSFLVGEPAAAAAQPRASAVETPEGAAPYVEALAAAEGRASDLERELQLLRDEMVAGGGVPAADLPVVAFVGAGYADSDLRSSFESALVAPLGADAVQRGAVLVGVIVTVPEYDGEPFSYTAVYIGEDARWSTFGLRGESLGEWTPDCPEGC